MALEFFQGNAKQRFWSYNVPQISIYRSGSIAFSPYAVTYFKLKIGMTFLLGWDPDTQTIHFRPCQDDEKGARKLSCVNAISCMAFFTCFHIPWRNEKIFEKRFLLNEIDGDITFSLGAKKCK